MRFAELVGIMKPTDKLTLELHRQDDALIVTLTPTIAKASLSDGATEKLALTALVARPCKVSLSLEDPDADFERQVAQYAATYHKGRNEMAEWDKAVEKAVDASKKARDKKAAPAPTASATPKPTGAKATPTAPAQPEPPAASSPVVSGATAASSATPNLFGNGD